MPGEFHSMENTQEDQHLPAESLLALSLHLEIYTRALAWMTEDQDMDCYYL
jgi:hypothetical protein